MELNNPDDKIEENEDGVWYVDEADNVWYKEDKENVIWWKDIPEVKGVWEFSFDRNKIFNLFQDYPYALTPEEKDIFDRENPEWADFFADRT